MVAIETYKLLNMYSLHCNGIKFQRVDDASVWIRFSRIMEQTYIAKNELEDRLLLLCNLHRIQTQLLTIILHLLTK